ncbi:MAG: DNA-binding protein [Erysipelotrichaceae bacterium]|nr:DNA-binding protein [Erysipelotrichaceae bacterium]
MTSDRDHINDLLDFYGDLLTKHQRDVFGDYYREDLSMQEIAENYQVSKAAVSDLIKRTLKQLEDYESKLHMIDQFQKIDELVSKMNQEKDDLVRGYAIELDRLNRG